jgi:hypothetical protein
MIDGNPSGLPMAKVLTYGMDLAEALSHMHPEYVHRDLKPGDSRTSRPLTFNFAPIPCRHHHYSSL